MDRRGAGRENGWLGICVDEEEWLACEDPQPMLQFMRGKVSDRKLRLFACACCRGHWDELQNPSSRRAVKVVEGFVDGKFKEPDLMAAWISAQLGLRLPRSLHSVRGD